MENRRRVDPSGRGEARRATAAHVTLALLVLAGVVAGGGALLGTWRFLTHGEALRIREIRFEGLSRATADELLALSPVRAGDNLVAADLRAMEKALSRHPWIRAAHVRRSLPPALEVRVEERRAAALVELGGLYLVDADAEPFKRAAPGDGLDLPLVTGVTREDYVQRRAEVEPVLAGALALLDGYAKAGLEGRAAVSEVHVDLENNGITLYVGDEGTQVRLGSGDLSQKLARLKQTLAALGDGRRADVVHLDNRVHPTWVTVRLANGVGDPGGVAPAGSKAGGKGP